MSHQDEMKAQVKLWLKANGHDYAWLAQRCFVSETTVRNWMARKIIPASKAHIIEGIISNKPMQLPPVIQVEEETSIKLRLDPQTRSKIEKKAFALGKTLAEYIADEVVRLSENPTKE